MLFLGNLCKQEAREVLKNPAINFWRKKKKGVVKNEMRGGAVFLNQNKRTNRGEQTGKLYLSTLNEIAEFAKRSC